MNQAGVTKRMRVVPTCVSDEGLDNNSICFTLLSLAMQSTGYSSHISRTKMGKDVISTMKSKTPRSKSVEPLRTLCDTVTVGITAFGKSKSRLKRKKL